MEILACDASCASIRVSELALVMLCTQMDASVTKLDAGAQQIHGLVDYAIQLQKLCRVSSLPSSPLSTTAFNGILSFPFTDSRQHILPHAQHRREDSFQLQRPAENAVQAAPGVETLVAHPPQPPTDRQTQSLILPANHRGRQQHLALPHRKCELRGRFRGLADEPGRGCVRAMLSESHLLIALRQDHNNNNGSGVMGD